MKKTNSMELFSEKIESAIKNPEQTPDKFIILSGSQKRNRNYKTIVVIDWINGTSSLMNISLDKWKKIEKIIWQSPKVRLTS